MFTEDPYIKSIEKYFLTHMGKGIMLSYSDYELIQDWKKRNIPADVIIEGIKDAFSDTKNFDIINNKTRIRNLKSIKSYIADSIDIYTKTKADNASKDSFTESKYKDRVIEAINSYIAGVNDERILSEIRSYKDFLINLDKLNEFQEFEIMTTREKQLYDKIFNLLSQAEKNKILREADNKIDNRGGLTEQAYNKSLISFRNTIIKSMFSLDFLN